MGLLVLLQCPQPYMGQTLINMGQALGCAGGLVLFDSVPLEGRRAVTGWGS